MKTNIVILICLAILAAAGIFAYQNVYNVQVIILKDGQTIITEDAWIVSDSLFYKAEDDTHAVNMSLVSDIKQRGILTKGFGIFAIIKHHLLPWKHKSLDIVSQAQIETSDIKKWAPAAGIGLGGIALCIALFFFVKKTVRAKKAKKKRECAFPEATKDQRVYQGQEQVVQFFLTVFKAQKGAEPSAEAAFSPVDKRRSRGYYTYELRVKIHGDWATRRMTIGPIGEDTGSRSKCYYVIYDDHIVVKVPPKPIVDFDKYIKTINRDNQIAALMSPRECLVPRLSVILKKINPQEVDASLPVEALEKQYIEWLDENADCQSFLKIGDGFAHFMDLSKYFFLGHILQHIHNIGDKVSAEISRHPELVWNSVDFEARYGSQHAGICDRLHPVYTSFHNRIVDLLQQHHMDNAVSEFTIKEWFLIYLSGRKLSVKEIDLKPRVVTEMNGVTLKLFKEKQHAVENYQKMVRSYVVAQNLKQHSSQISSIIINLLDLLYWLSEKKLAMRDLKPDNLFVAGNPSKFPQFLGSANMYAIGLIDVETAVSYDVPDPATIRQPPLGGTPSHATPSHQLKNETIQKVYKDLALILHLQDWYATAAIIFQTVTGERLFEKTAKNLLQLKKTIKERSRKKGNPTAVLKDVSHSFWSMALMEFDAKIKENEKKLRFITQIIGQGSKEMLLRVIADTHQDISRSIHHLIRSQTVFKGEKTQKNLFTAPPQKLHQIRVKFVEGKSKQRSSRKIKTTEKILDDLVLMKKQSAQLIRTSTLLKKSVAIVSAYDLLNTMFTVVLVHMHQKQWGIVDIDARDHGNGNVKAEKPHDS